MHMEISVLLAINIILRNTYKHNCKQLIYINTVCISYKTSYFKQDAIFVSINYKNRFCKMSINMNNYCNQNITLETTKAFPPKFQTHGKPLKGIHE